MCKVEADELPTAEESSTRWMNSAGRSHLRCQHYLQQMEVRSMELVRLVLVNNISPMGPR